MLVRRTDLNRPSKRITVYMKPEYHRLLRSLEDEPSPRGCEKLSAQERFRIRQGDYGVVFLIDDSLRTVEVIKIGRRSEIYRD